jgi:hypothetical protein
MARKVDTHGQMAAEIAEAGIGAMARVMWGQTVSQDLMVDAALRILWAWCAPPEILSKSQLADSRRRH